MGEGLTRRRGSWWGCERNLGSQTGVGQGRPDPAARPYGACICCIVAGAWLALQKIEKVGMKTGQSGGWFGCPQCRPVSSIANHDPRAPLQSSPRYTAWTSIQLPTYSSTHHIQPRPELHNRCCVVVASFPISPSPCDANSTLLNSIEIARSYVCRNYERHCPAPPLVPIGLENNSPALIRPLPCFYYAAGC